MSASEIALRYSQGLFKLHSSKDERESLLKDLEQIVSVFNQFPQCALFFSSPIIDIERKEKVLQRILKNGSEGNLIPFLSTLLKKRRFNNLPEIVKELRKKVSQDLGVLEGRLITSDPIDGDTKKELVRKLEQKYRKKILLKEEIDPQLIGGGMLIVGNDMVDFSIRNKLENLKENLSAVSV